MKDNINVEVIKAGKTGLFCNYIFKAIPLAFDESMSYYECLCGLLNYLKNTIIPTVNNNADAVAELQKLFTKLQEYVNNYFDNLDVQDEINNKLDQMVEDGTLPETIASYLNSKAIFGYDTVNDMVNATNLINGSYAKTLGFYAKNDGGSALYKIRTITNEDIVDEMTIIALNDTSLIAELIIGDFIKPEQLGAKGDNIQDDLPYLNKALQLNNNILLSANKTYLITNTLIIDKVIYLNGYLSKIHYNGNGTAISVTSSGNLHTNDKCIIENLIINAENSDKVINWNYSIKSLLRNIKIYNFSHYGIYVQRAGYETRFENIYFACKKLTNTVAIYGNLSDMDFGALYGVNVKIFMQITGCATKIELIHAWCANIPLFNEPIMNENQYNEWFSNTILINFKEEASSYPLIIDYLYADTYHDVLYYQSYHRFITINNLSFRKSINLIKYDEEYKNYIIYTNINNIYIDKTKLEYIGIYPSISKINGFKASKTRRIKINDNIIDVPVDNIVPYTIKQTGALNIKLKYIVGLPAIYSVKDYGANCKLIFPNINVNGIDIDYSNYEDVPSTEYNVMFYLKAKPIQRGEPFKYTIIDNTLD